MAFKISLNGSNYTSEAREKAFEEALSEANTVLASPEARPTAPAGKTNGGDGGNGHHEMAASAVRASASPEPATSDVTNKAPQVIIKDYGRVLEGLERGLAQSYDHQSEMLRVHEQYLSNQASYANIFSDLMREQGTLFSDDNTSGERAEVLLQVLQSLNRSVEQFHTHQSDTLDVHGQFLQQQANYAQAFIELLQTHYGSALNGNGNGHNGNCNGHTSGNGNGNGATQKTPATRPIANSLPVASPPPQAVAPAPAAVRDEPADVVVAAQVEQVIQPAAPVVAEPSVSVDADELSGALLDIVSDKTGYPAEMLELDMDMEADLGIDSIKRVEILGALQDAYPGLPDVEADVLAELRTLAQVLDYMSDATNAAPADESPVAGATAGVTADVVDVAPAVVPVDAGEAPVGVSSGVVDAAALSQDLLEIVSDKTGYPAEMLELDMDMEADLGIDSIKRVEILGALQDQHPDLPEVETDALAELRTLAQILDYMAVGVGDAAVVPSVDASDPKKA